MKVIGLHSNRLDRQVAERVNIENFRGEILMNRRNEMGGVTLEGMQYRRWGWRSAGVSGKIFWVAFYQGVLSRSPTSRVLGFGRLADVQRLQPGGLGGTS
jgi:hypothetical protein